MSQARSASVIVAAVAGAPDWVTADRYDVDARATFTPTVDQRRVLLRAVLAERFKFASHVETHDRPIYNLVLAGGRLSPGLRRVDVDCDVVDRRTLPRDVPALAGLDAPLCGYRVHADGSHLMLSGGLGLQRLSDLIAGRVGRPVFDRTGLTGYFAFRLEDDDGTDGASLFTALQEQLGLKLESSRGPVEILAIDHIERPTEN